MQEHRTKPTAVEITDKVRQVIGKEQSMVRPRGNCNYNYIVARFPNPNAQGTKKIQT